MIVASLYFVFFSYTLTSNKIIFGFMSYVLSVIIDHHMQETLNILTNQTTSLCIYLVLIIPIDLEGLLMLCQLKIRTLMCPICDVGRRYCISKEEKNQEKIQIVKPVLRCHLWDQ